MRLSVKLNVVIVKGSIIAKIILGIIILMSSLMIYDNQKHDIVPMINTVAKKVDPRQLKCMAYNIFHEANGETLHGQIAVARVVINRINHGFAKTPCSVIYQEFEIDEQKICQFSWTCDDKLDTIHPNNPAYKRAENIAFYVLAYDAFKDAIPESVLFFHNIRVNPNWPYQKIVTIGNHIFYRKKENGKVQN